MIPGTPTVLLRPRFWKILKGVINEGPAMGPLAIIHKSPSCGNVLHVLERTPLNSKPKNRYRPKVSHSGGVAIMASSLDNTQ